MKIKTITVEKSITLSLPNYGSVRTHIGLTADIEETALVEAYSTLRKNVNNLVTNDMNNNLIKLGIKTKIQL